MVESEYNEFISIKMHEIRNKTHKVAVGGRVHALRASDDDDDHDVAEHADDEHDALEEGADGPVAVRVVLRLGPQVGLVGPRKVGAGDVAGGCVGAAAQRHVVRVHDATRAGDVCGGTDSDGD